MSDSAAEMVTFARGRLNEAYATAATDEERRYIRAMRDIVLMHDDIGPAYCNAIAGGDKTEIRAASLARLQVVTAIGFIATARDDHPGFREEWRP